MADVQEINKLFRDYGRTLGSVESFTGGLFAKEITSVPGASHFYKGGLVTYATEEKNRLVGVTYQEIDTFGVVSKEVATMMAVNGRKVLNVDYCVSFTGNAGPDAMEGKPVGEVYIAIATQESTKVFGLQLSGTREEIQQKGVEQALNLLKQTIFENN